MPRNEETNRTYSSFVEYKAAHDYPLSSEEKLNKLTPEELGKFLAQDWASAIRTAIVGFFRNNRPKTK